MDHEVKTVQCEVTGNTISRDDAVFFQGKWVGAEGKTILLDQLQTGLTPSNVLVTASVWHRFFGAAIDSMVVLLGPIFAIIIVILLLQSYFDIEGRLNKAKEINNIVGSIGVTVIPILYYWVFHYSFGRTLGKYGARTRVVQLDGSELLLSQAFLRATYYCLINMSLAVGMMFIAIVRLMGISRFHPIFPFLLIIVGGFASVSVVAFVADIVVALYDRRLRRSIHDRLAGTRVVQVS